MNKTNELIKILDEFYGNGILGLASKVGYLTGMLKEIELEYKSAGTIYEEHIQHIKKNLCK